jgi:hypothetical protein
LPKIYWEQLNRSSFRPLIQCPNLAAIACNLVIKSACWCIAIANATVHNTIIAGNMPSLVSPNPDVRGYFYSKGYNLIGNGAGATGFDRIGDQVGSPSQPLNAKLGPLEDYGSPLYTMMPAWGSLAVNAGDPALMTEKDQNGILRSQAGRPDIGALEWVNQAPIAVNDSVTLSDRSVVFNPLRNDRDPDGQAIWITSYTNPNIGTLTQNPDGSFVYTLSNSEWFLFPSVASFTYTITDGVGGTSQATVRLNRR